MNRFFQEVLEGLSASPKYLSSKYFYDEAGDKLFQQIMNCPEYYPTKCELEIFSQQTDALIDAFTSSLKEFDVIELGAGDATKSSYLLKRLQERKVSFTYYPIDISKNVINLLQDKLPAEIPGIKIHGLNGEYLDMLKEAGRVSAKPKVVLFLGSNIGNIPLDDAGKFCNELRAHLSKGDLLLIGFDLKKNPKVILDAYNDKAGLTRAFNLNLLHRINKELGADFNKGQFDHFPVYDPETGACKSYLISLKKQQVTIGDTEVIDFAENEAIFMEISQKYSLQQTDDFAQSSGFKPLYHFFDEKKWFLDTIWACV